MWDAILRARTGQRYPGRASGVKAGHEQGPDQPPARPCRTRREVDGLRHAARGQDAEQRVEVGVVPPHRQVQAARQGLRRAVVGPRVSVPGLGPKLEYGAALIDFFK